MDGVIPLIIALIAVGVILYLSYLFSRYLAVGAARINKSKYIKIVDRTVLGQDRMLLITQIGDKYYLIGSSSQTINILTEIDEKDIIDTSYSGTLSGDPAGNSAFKNIFKKFQE